MERKPLTSEDLTKLQDKVDRGYPLPGEIATQLITELLELRKRLSPGKRAPKVTGH